jgi:hypothetical protein
MAPPRDLTVVNPKRQKVSQDLAVVPSVSKETGTLGDLKRKQNALIKPVRVSSALLRDLGPRS